MELFKLFGTIAVKNDEANEAIDETTNNVEDSKNQMNDAFKKIGLAIAAAFAIDKLIDFGKEIVGLSAEVSAEQSAFDQIMGDYAGSATEKMAQVAESVGATDTRLTPFMTSLTAKFKGLGYDIDDATSLASRGLTLASDASAFWDKSLQDSMGALNSFINGSYEGGEAIGLFANDTQLAQYAIKKGLVATTAEWSALDEATKQATRLEYAEAMMAASGAVGQAAKEADQYANVQANLTEKWRQFKAQIGEPLLQNVVLPALKKVSGAVEVLIAFVKDVKENWDQWEGPLTVGAILIGALTTAILAYNIAQKWTAIVTAVTTGATTAFGAVLAFITSPITLVVLAIGALIAIGVLLYKNWDTVKAKIAEIWNGIVKKSEELNQKVEDTFNKIKDAMEKPINKARDTIKAVIDKIKGFFDFKWSLPKLKLPKVSIDGKFSLVPPSVPKFNIEWFADGGIMRKPTMFDYNPQTGKARVGGEAGNEAIAPIDLLLEYIRTAVGEQMGSVAEALERLISMLASYFPQILQGMDRDIVLDGDALVGRLTPKFDAKLGQLQSGKGRGR